MIGIEKDYKYMIYGKSVVSLDLTVQLKKIKQMFKTYTG